MMAKLSIWVVLGCWVLSAAGRAEEPKVLFENDPSLLTTAVSVVITTGSSDDPVGKSGLANLLGQMMLRGTKKRSRTRFQNELERLGASLAIHVSHDSIDLDGRVIKENTGEFLKLIDDCLLHPAFSPKELASLKTEILASIAAKKGQNNRLSGLAMRKTLFANTPLERPMDGAKSTISKITLEDLQKSYNDRLHRGNILFAAVSALPEADFKSAFKATWLQFPDGLKKNQKSVPPQLPKAPTVVVVQKAETSTGAFMLGQGGITAQDPFRYTLSVADYSFGGEVLVSRLFKVIRGELGWTYAIGSTFGAMGELSYQQGIYVINATPSVEYTGKSILKALSMFKDYYEHGLRPDEITLGKDGLVNSYPFEFESAEKRLARKLHSYLYNVPILTPEQYEKKIMAISNDDIKKALREKLTADGWVIAVVADSKVIEAQLEAEQKNVPEAQRIKVSKILTPEQLVD
jgi:zinc protease